MSRFEPSSYPVESILQELRGADGELFRAEVSQRLYLILKRQAQDSLYALYANSTAKKSPGRGKDVYSKALQAYSSWNRQVRDEELKQLTSKHPDIEDLWKEVAMFYVRVCHKFTDARLVSIKAPSVEELLQNFLQGIVAAPCTMSGDIWSYDHVKLDFTMREFFRRAVMDSVHIVRVTQTPAQQPKRAKKEEVELEDDIYPDDSVSAVMHRKPRAKPAPKPKPAAESSSESEADLESATVLHASLERQDAATVLHQTVEKQDAATVFNQTAERDTATVLAGQGPAAADSATVLQTPKQHLRFADTATLVRPSDAMSSVSSTSSTSSRFSKLTSPKFVPLHVLQSIDETADEIKRVPLTEDVREEDSDDDAPIRVNLSRE